MRTESASQAVFAAALVAVGVLLLLHGDLNATGEAYRMTPHAHAALGYLQVAVFIACGAGLFWRTSAPHAARVFLVYELLWMLVFKLREVAAAPLSGQPYESWGETAVLIAAGWVLYARSFEAAGPRKFHFAAGVRGTRVARVFYGLAMLGFGQAHFTFLDLTAPLVPGWLPWHVAWAYFFGATYLATGVAVLTGIYARLAASLSALQMGLFTVLVWGPVVWTGRANADQWGEFTGSLMFAVAGWVVAESYRGIPWFTPGRSAARTRC